MPSDFNLVKYYRPKFSFKVYTAIMKTIENSLNFEVSNVAKYRLHVLDHFYKFGYKSAVSAFNVKQSTLYDWKNLYEKSKKNLNSLVPCSTRPKHTREMKVSPNLSSFIKSFREEYGNISKYKIKIFLDEYARSIGEKSYGFSKIGKLIKRRGWFFEAKKSYKKKRKDHILRLKRAPKADKPGYLEMDSITLYVNSKKFYFSSIIDVFARFAWVKLVPSLSSENVRESFIDFQKIYQRKINTVQTDNGSEFLKFFDKYLKEKNINHEFIYPRSPKINGVVERFNRTIQEEFINRSDEIYFDTNLFEKKMIKYLNWYNYKRPHYALNFKTPYSYLIQGDN
jgi:transposase InsO family protein